MPPAASPCAPAAAPALPCGAVSAGGVGMGGGDFSYPDFAAEGIKSSIPQVQCSHSACVHVHLLKNMHKFKRLVVTQKSILWDRIWGFMEGKD